MYDCHTWQIVVDCVLQSLANQTLGTLLRHRLDANTAVLWEANFGHAKLVLQDLNQLVRFRRSCLILHARIDVFRVLAENHHVGFFRLLHRAWNAGEVAHWAQAQVKIELLTKRHVQRPNSTANWRGQWPFDSDFVLFKRFKCLVWQPFISAIGRHRFFATVDFHPRDRARTTVGLLDRGVDHFNHGWGNIDTDTVAFNKGDDRVIGNVQRAILVHRDFLT